MARKERVIAWSVAALVTLCGCTTVNPRLDYERAASHVTEATGQESIYLPGDEEIVARKVTELLGDGLTADEAVQICLLNNPKLQAAFFRVGMARADVVQSGLLSNPSVGVSLRFPSGGGLANLEADLAQNIAELWRIPVRRRVYERFLEQAVLELAREASILAARAKTAYYRAVAAAQGLAIANENLEIAKQLLDLAVTLQAAGAGSGVDVNLSRSALRQTELAARSARLALFEARSELATLLGLEASPGELELRDALPSPPTWSFSVERLLQLAATKRLDVKAARQAVEAMAANARLEGLRVFPVVELGVSLEREARSRSRGRKLLAETARSSLEASEFSLPRRESAESDGPGFVIGPSLSLEIPIFDQNQAQIAKAEYAYRQAVKVLRGLLLQVAQETRLAHERATAAWDIARFYESSVLPLGERNLELARDAYRAGKVPLVSVLEAQRTLQASRGGYVEALQDAAIGCVELERVTGQPIEKVLAAAAEGRS
jgi:cobalt-zinc-cadmium efflux system outer membrane protein